jgi:hypothetical protein
MQKIFKISGVLAIVAGIILVIGGVWGIGFTYQNIAQEKIVTPSDSSLPNQPVRGPLTLKAQADIIREHTLKATGGLTYAEMPQKITQVDSNGQSISVPNTARDIWITSTALRTALNLGILTYVFSGLVLLFGCISIWTGVLFYALSKRNSLATL